MSGTSMLFSVGRDCQVVIDHPLAGGSLIIEHVTGFDPKQGTAPTSVDRLDGIYLTKFLPKNWTGTLHLERGGPEVDQFFTTIEAAYYSGVQVPYGTVTQYVTEPSGSVTTYQFSGASFHLLNAGAWKNDKSVLMQIGFAATRREML